MLHTASIDERPERAVGGVEPAISALQREGRDALDAREPSGQHHPLETGHGREPEGMAVGRPDEERVCLLLNVLVRVDGRTDDCLAAADASQTVERAEGIGEVQQHAGAEHQIEHTDTLRRQVVDVAEEAFDSRSASLNRKAECAAMVFVGWRSLAVRLAQRRARIVIDPIRELGRRDLGPTSFELEGKEPVTGSHVEHRSPIEARGQAVVLDDLREVILARRDDAVPEIDRVIPLVIRYSAPDLLRRKCRAVDGHVPNAILAFLSGFRLMLGVFSHLPGLLPELFRTPDRLRIF